MVSDGLDELMSDLIQDFSSRANDKPLLWIVYGNDLEACLPKLKASFPNQASSQARVPAAQQSAVTDVKLIILWITPSQMNAGLGNIKQVALELEQWAKEPTSPLLTTIVVEDDSPFEQAMKDRWRDLLSRSVASVLLSPVAVEGTKASFASLMQQFKDKTIPFVTLASAAIGVDSQKGAFNYGYSEGRAGEIDPRVASLRMAKLADMAFGYTKQTLWSVTDKGANPGSSPDDASRTPKGWSDQQAGTIVNIITPTQLQADEPTRRFLGAICGWLQQDYRIPAGQVTIERLLERSGEMKPSLEDTMVNLKGGHYFHFTAMRGVVNAGGTAIIPEILQGALQQGGAQPGGAPVGGVQPVVAQNPAATTP